MIKTIIVLSILAQIIGVVFSLFLNESYNIFVGDFPSFYISGILLRRGINFYDFEIQRNLQIEFWGSVTDSSFLPFVYPAFTSYLFYVFTYLPPQISKVIFSCLNLLLFYVSINITAPPVKNKEELSGLWKFLFVISLQPVFLGLVMGQCVGLSFFLITVCLLFSRKKNLRSKIFSGISLGFLCYKPHFAIFISLYIFLKREWIILLTSLIVLVCLYFVGVRATHEYSWPLLYFHWITGYVAVENNKNILNEISLISNFTYLYGVSHFLGVLALSSIALYLYKTLKISKEINQIHLFLPSLIVLVNPHILFYDIGIAFIPLIFLVLNNSSRLNYFAYFIYAVFSISLPHSVIMNEFIFYNIIRSYMFTGCLVVIATTIFTYNILKASLYKSI